MFLMELYKIPLNTLCFFLNVLLLFMGHVYDHFPKQFFVVSSNEQFAEC